MPLIVANYNVTIDGKALRKGEKAELPASQMLKMALTEVQPYGGQTLVSIVDATEVEKKPATPARVNANAPVVEVLTNAQIRDKLTAMGIDHSKATNKAMLEALLAEVEQATGENAKTDTLATLRAQAVEIATKEQVLDDAMQTEIDGMNEEQLQEFIQNLSAE